MSTDSCVSVRLELPSAVAMYAIMVQAHTVPASDRALASCNNNRPSLRRIGMTPTHRHRIDAGLAGISSQDDPGGNL